MFPAYRGRGGGRELLLVAVEESFLKAYFVSSDLLVGELDVQRLSGGPGSLGIIVC